MKIQASSVHRILNCACSLSMTPPKDMINAPKMFASTFGSNCHEIAEKQLKSYVDKVKVPTIRSMINDLNMQPVDFDKAKNAIELYVKHIKKIITKAKNKSEVRFLIEDKYKFKFKDYELVAKMDFMSIYYNKDTLYIDICDLKTGVWDYSGSAYDQMYFTVLLVLYKDYKKYTKFDIKIHTIQPNYFLDNMKIVIDRIEHEGYKPKDLLEAFLFEIQFNKDRVKPGGYCKFCPALLICPKAKELILIIENKEVDDMTIEELEFVQENSDFLKTYLKAVEAHLIENEKKLKNFKIKHNKKSKKLVKINNPFKGIDS